MEVRTQQGKCEIFHKIKKIIEAICLKTIPEKLKQIGQPIWMLYGAEKNLVPEYETEPLYLYKVTFSCPHPI